MALFISANMHQGDERFSVHCRGKFPFPHSPFPFPVTVPQFPCFKNSLPRGNRFHRETQITVTARSSYNISSSAWSTTTFNNVLTQGDKVYSEVLHSGFITLDPNVDFVSVEKLTYSC